MNAPIEYRIKREKGRRFAVVPYEQFTRLMERAGNAPTIPHEVAARHLVEGISLARAWREHLGFTQADIAARIDVSQAQIAQWERPGARPRHASLARLAAAMGLAPSQLTLKEGAATI